MDEERDMYGNLIRRNNSSWFLTQEQRKKRQKENLEKLRNPPHKKGDRYA